MHELSLFKKFCKKCAARILHYARLDPEEVARKIGKQYRLSADDIAKTQRIMRKTAQEIVAKRQMDTFRWK